MMVLGAMGAMRMTSNDLLNAHADIYPVTILANEVCFRATARYITLDKEHSLHKPINKAQRYVKRHQGPLHELLNAF